MLRIFKFKALMDVRNSLCHSSINRHIRPIQAFNFSTRKAEISNEGPEEPVSYLKSDAAKWLAKDSRTLGTDERLWYQPHVLIFSLASLLIYFCVLREENDIDILLSEKLDDKIPGMEKRNFELIQQTNK